MAETVESGERGPGGTVLLTGVSGFLGKVVLGRLLSVAERAPRLVLLVRAPDDEAAAARLRAEVADSEALGSESRRHLEEGMSSGEVVVLAADVARDRLGGIRQEALREVETVIHCAATVSFEEPLDEAVETNALGPLRLLEAVRDAGADPHFVHVSTAYAADCRTATVSEEDYAHPAVGELDVEEMLASSGRWREEAEDESRQDARRRRLERAAARDAATRRGIEAGPRAEELRRRWVRYRLGERGRDFAVAAGWPDTYALTKAVGERLLVENWRRLTILRPTIIESALRLPRPGWLEGIKVADPLILAYGGRGLTHLPGRWENRIDIVPVDCVANACVAAALYPADALRVLAVASTARNPLRLGELGENVRTYFSTRPLSPNGSAAEIRELRFVDRETALRATRRRQRIAAAGARAASAPFVPRATESRLRKLEFLAGQITRMIRLYGPYTELDVVFDDGNLRALAGQMSERHREALPFDTAAFDWGEYLQDVHLPEVRRLATQRS